MDQLARKTILSGVQPIDRLMGGLDSGQLYLVDGEITAASLCGITFLIEGLKRGEHCALVVNCSPEDAVSLFAEIGYDCVEDVFGGRLVIIECTDDMIEQIARPGQLTPALREIEWLLGETRPHRLVFDPVTNILAGVNNQIEARVAEFAQWTKSLGAAAFLIGEAANSEVTRLLKPHVAESFRFEIREAADRGTEFIIFEKSLTLADQAVEVDPSRGVFLSDRAQPASPSGAPVFSAPGPDIRLVDLDVPPSKQEARTTLSELETTTQNERRDYTGGRVNEMTPLELDLEIEDVLSRLVEIKNQPANTTQPSVQETSSRLLQHPEDSRNEEVSDQADVDLASELFGDLASILIPDNLESTQAIVSQSGQAQTSATEISGQSPSRPSRSETWKASASAPLDTGARQASRGETAPLVSSPFRTGKRASDIKINAAMAARAVETLLGPEKTQKPAPDETPAPVLAPAPASAAQESVDPKSFRVLLIDDEAESCEMIIQSLSDFTIEKIHDGVRGLARLISYKPDLVVLDLDLNVIDGFKLLAHIRARLNVPVIIISSELVRANEGVPAPDPVADADAGVNQLAKALAASGYYHLTTEFSTKQLTQKARQLIARYRGIDSWITNLSARSSEHPRSTEPLVSTAAPQPFTTEAYADGFMPYEKFVVEVEKRVKAVIDNGSALSVVGCRVPQMTTANGNTTHSILLDAVRRLVRDTDLASTNVPGDVVILLADARASGARAFAVRLRETLAQKLNEEPSVWMRTFPGLEEASEMTVLSASPTNGARHRRRATD